MVLLRSTGGGGKRLPLHRSFIVLRFTDNPSMAVPSAYGVAFWRIPREQRKYLVLVVHKRAIRSPLLAIGGSHDSGA